MVRRLPKRDRIVPFRKPPVCYSEEPEMGARWQTLLAAVADIHAIIRGVLSKSMRAARQLPPGEALLAAYDDLDFLLRSTGAFVHVYGCDPYSFATRLSRIAQGLDECASVTLTI